MSDEVGLATPEPVVAQIQRVNNSWTRGGLPKELGGGAVADSGQDERLHSQFTFLHRQALLPRL